MGEVEVEGWEAIKWAKTEWICVASSLPSSREPESLSSSSRIAHRVGETMMAPISRLPSTFSRRRIFSSTGITNASVLPDPVTACREWPQKMSSLLSQELARTHLDYNVLVLHEEGNSASLDWSHLLESHVAYDVGAGGSRKGLTLGQGCFERREPAYTQGDKAGLSLDQGPA